MPPRCELEPAQASARHYNDFRCQRPVSQETKEAEETQETEEAEETEETQETEEAEEGVQPTDFGPWDSAADIAGLSRVSGLSE